MGEVSFMRPNGADACTRDDVPQHFVRVTRADHHGYTEFQFSIGDPDLYLEMTLPPAAFAEFCARHQVVHLTAAQAQAVDVAARRWRSGPESEDETSVD
jgi:phenol hydroxylase P0 protein